MLILILALAVALIRMISLSLLFRKMGFLVVKGLYVVFDAVTTVGHHLDCGSG